MTKQNVTVGGKEILLRNGQIALVDEDDYDRINASKWCMSSNGYAVRGLWDGETVKTNRMHWEVIGRPKKGYQIDHINNNKLDNRKANLRVATHGENSRNVPKRKDNVSGYKGVHWSTNAKKWVAQIQINRKRYYLGSFNNLEEAYRVYCNACVKYHGEFAKIN